MPRDNEASSTFHEVQSPFLLSPTEVFREEPASTVFQGEVDSPFLTSYQITDEEAAFDPREQLFVQFVDELTTEGFTESTIDLFNEAERYLDYHISLSPVNEEIVDAGRKEQLLLTHFQPLAVATEHLVDQLSYEFANRDMDALTEGEIDAIFAKYQQAHELGNPVFENFFKKTFQKLKKGIKKVGSLVKKGVKLVGKFHPLALLLKQVKKMIRPFLTKVIGNVINKLPEALRAPARMLAGKLGIKAELQLTTLEIAEREVTDDDYQEEYFVASAGPDLELLEREFDLRLAEQLFAQSEEEEVRIFDAYLDRQAEKEAATTEAQLYQARKQLVEGIQTAKTAEEIVPNIEQFIGVAAKAVKLGIRVIGRDKVIAAVAKLFAKFIAPLIGPQAADPLARALVDKGFAFLNLEVSEREANQAAAESMVQVLEEMTQDLVTLDQETLHSPELLEREMHQLFSHYVARNIPSNMVQEELQESEQAAAWVLLPKDGQKRYKKYSQVMEVTLSRDQIKGLKTFGGNYLQSFLSQRFNHTSSQPLNVKVHLYEAVRGTTLSHITLLEKKVSGLGSARREAWSQLHPLTPEAAGRLLGNAALGPHVAERWLSSRHRIRPGQRFYYLEVAGMVATDQPMALPAVSSATAESIAPVTQEDAMVKLDFTRSTMTLALSVTEPKASEITRRLRSGDHFGAATTFRTAIRNALNNILLRDVGRHVKVIMELSEDHYLEEHFGSLLRAGGALLGNVAKDQLKKVAGKLIEKLVAQTEKALIALLKRLSDDFIRAQEHPASGLTMHLVFIDMPGMAIIRTFFKLKQGKPVSVGDVTGSVLPAIPTPDLRIFPGRKAL